jgi:Zn-finger nucleic acid-binding protein
MNCPSCNAPIDVSTELPGSEVRCACGVMVQVPAKPAGRESKRSGACPRCAVALAETATIGGLGAQACPACGGVFADRAAVAALASSTLAPSPSLTIPTHRVDTSGYVKCPGCGDLMKRVNFGRKSGVIVDVCVDHGTWFDADEIDRVAAFIASGGLTRGGGEIAMATTEGAQLSAEGRRMLGELQAQVTQDRYDQMHRVERTTWFARSGIRLLFDWIT